MSYVKNYEVGNVRLDTPNKHIVHELPLLSFGDARNTFALSLIFQSKLTTNPFYIANGYKLSIQKRIIVENGVPQSYEDGNGSLIKLNSCYSNKYAFDDGSMRFIRLIDNKYVLENPDYSKEIFAKDGRLFSVIDKYGNTILSYTYSAERLISVKYKDSKTVTLGYNSNGILQTIEYTYANVTYATTFTYSGSKVIVSHYSGVDYHLTYASGNFEVFSANAGGAYSNDMSYKDSVIVNGNVITIEKYRGDKKLDKVAYNFVNCDSSGKANILDITNIDNVTTRVQFSNDKPAYSYEMLDPMFVTHPTTNDPYYPGGVTFYNNDQAIGSQCYGDGYAMKCYTGVASASVNDYATLHNFSGMMTVSGWLQSKNDALTEGHLMIYSGDTQIGSYIIKGLIKDVWTYFSVSFFVENSTDIKVLTNETATTLWAYDFRLTGQPSISTDVPEYKENLINAAGVLIHTDSSGVDHPIPIASAVEFINGASLIDKNAYPITANDLMRYKVNQILGTNAGEIYYNDGRGILPLTSTFYVRYLTPEGTTITANLIDLAIGKMHSSNNNLFVTKTQLVTLGGNVRVKTESSKNSVYYKVEILDNKLDLIESTTDSVTTTYERNANTGLITRQILSNSYNNEQIINSAVYDSNDFLFSTTDEFGTVTTYTTDPTWGVVTKSEISDGTSVTDTFDSDYSTQKTRTFSKTASGATYSKTHTFGHTNGNLSSITDGSLTYQFTYSDGDLASVIKNGTTVGTYTISEDRKTYTGTYGSYSITEKYDKYGRLTNADDKVENTYDVEPHLDSNNIFNSRAIDNAASKLAKSEDLITGKVSKYCYSKNQLTKIGVHDSNDTLLSTELFNYDGINRATKHTTHYDIANSKSVSESFTYVNSADSPLADNRIATHTYSVNGVEKVGTQNRYLDRFKRMSAKLISINGSTYEKDIYYDKTRISRAHDVRNGSTINNVYYGYDAMGRIVKESDAVITDSTPATYVYDSFGRLIQENNKALDKTFVFKYNDNGNIIGCDTLAYTTANVSNANVTVTHVYDSTIKDRLKSFNGSSISYDSNGYPTYYNNKNYIWTKDKLTRIFRGNGSQYGSLYEYCNFAYDGYGRRKTKSYSYDPNPGSTSDYSYMYTTTYDYDTSGRLIHETCVETTTYTGGSSSTRDITYLYDETGIVGAVQKVGSTETTFYFDKNIKGDVIGIYNSSGTRIANYSYDAWGNCTTKTLVANSFIAYNPIRYRGYYYDRETKLYYLNARYYDPSWRRFISPDDTAYLDPDTPIGLNLYAYCNNDPVNYADPSGHFPVLAVILGLTALVGMGLTIGGVVSDNNLMTAIGLTMVAIPALISGGLAAFATTGALATGIGIGTMVAGAGTGLFASAEYQETFSGNNWMLDAGMSEDWYTGLMIATAGLATLGTFASSVAYSFNINKITEFGKISGSKYPGMKFTQIRDGRSVYRSLEFHHGHMHKEHRLHWQLNKWSKAGIKSRGGVDWWTMWLTRIP